MIPKIIHYCWFGSSPKSDKTLKYIAEWKRLLPDYQFREWNEDDLKYIHNCYMEEAYKASKWAFVSDFVRLYALYTEGGVYFDTDIELKKDISPLLQYDFFIGNEYYIKSNTYNLATAVIGSTAKNPIVKEMLNLYKKLHFIRPDKTYDLLPNPERLFPIIQKNGYSYHCENMKPVLFGINNAVLPHNWLSTKSKNSYAIHHFDGSWVEPFKVKCKIKINLWKYDLKLIKIKRIKPNTLYTVKDGYLLFSSNQNKKTFWNLIVEKRYNIKINFNKEFLK